MVVGWSRFAVDSVLLWRCWCGRGWALVGVVRVARAGMCLRVGYRKTLSIDCLRRFDVLNITGRDGVSEEQQ